MKLILWGMTHFSVESEVALIGLQINESSWIYHLTYSTWFYWTSQLRRGAELQWPDSTQPPTDKHARDVVTILTANLNKGRNTKFTSLIEIEAPVNSRIDDFLKRLMKSPFHSTDLDFVLKVGTDTETLLSNTEVSTCSFTRCCMPTHWGTRIQKLVATIPHHSASCTLKRRDWNWIPNCEINHLRVKCQWCSPAPRV